MSGSVYGKNFTVTTWGESHGAGIGVVIDGCPAGLSLSKEELQSYLDLRKPGMTKYATPRKENDMVEILSGTFEGKTTGTPISLLVRNESQRSNDYSEIASYYRPGHADYTFDQKYGFRDYRGGGRSSARETIGRVAAGAIAKKILSSLSIDLFAYVKSIGPVEVNESEFDRLAIMQNVLRMPDNKRAEEAGVFLDQCIKDGDSSGGMIECRILNLPAGIGEPVFDKLDACLAKACLSIGAVKSFEIGDGILVSQSLGSQNNDAFYSVEDENGCKIKKRTNHSGGVLGGISDGSDVLFRCAFKPTPSIRHTQNTVKNTGENIEVSITGRHDPVVLPRAVVVVESMAAITLVDLLFDHMHAQMDQLIRFYQT
ncbi:MAG: chorismate synthase [Clostridia bacterium]|nr:chorismate synthase [Clostridia bacterium]